MSGKKCICFANGRKQPKQRVIVLQGAKRVAGTRINWMWYQYYCENKVISLKVCCIFPPFLAVCFLEQEDTWQSWSIFANTCQQTSLIFKNACPPWGLLVTGCNASLALRHLARLLVHQDKYMSQTSRQAIFQVVLRANQCNELQDLFSCWCNSGLKGNVCS